jgi:hypothetical protein
MNTRYVRISDLKEKMRMAEGIFRVKKGNKILYEKNKLLHFDYVDMLMQKKRSFIHCVSDEGLSISDVRRIQKMKSDGKLKFDRILVHKDIPFAIFLLLAFLITVLIKTNFIDFIKLLI